MSQKELKKKRLEEQRIKAFRDYFHYSEELRKIPPHRILAINRGERAKVLRVKIECDIAAMHAAIDELLVPPGHPHADYLRGCARDSLDPADPSRAGAGGPPRVDRPRRGPCGGRVRQEPPQSAFAAAGARAARAGGRSRLQERLQAGGAWTSLATCSPTT